MSSPDEQNMSPLDVEYYNMVKEKTDCSDVQSSTEDFIAKESERCAIPISQYIPKSSCTLLPTILAEDNQSNKSCKHTGRDSTDSSDTDIADDGRYKNLKSASESNVQSSSDSIDVNTEKKEYDPTIDDRLPETVTLLTTSDGGKLYLIGTAHFSVESQNDVSQIIQAVQPHVVVVELCKNRIGLLQLDQQIMYVYAKNLTYQGIVDTVKENGLYNGLFYILLLRLASKVSEDLGMAPGGEFRRAFLEAQKVPHCVLHLADRPIDITLQRAIRTLSWWQLMKLVWHLISFKDSISKEDVERYKKPFLLDDVFAQLENKFPGLGEIFIKERDLYLTYNLQLTCESLRVSKRCTSPRIVGIVGMGHVPGIVQNWGKVKDEDILPLMSIPPQSLSTKILRYTMKASVLGVVIYTGYRIIPLPFNITLQSIKSSVEGLLKIMVSMEVTSCTDEYEHVVPGVMYVINNIPGPGINIDDFESEYSTGCPCTNECSDLCSCVRGSINYINDCILEEKLAGPIIECNCNCACSLNCGNRLVQRGPLNSLVVVEVGEKGLGLKTTALIKKGQFICEYAGEVISIQEARNRVETNKRNKSMNYVLVVFEHIGDRIIETCIDPKYFGNIGRYANHSCQPNASLVPVRVDGIVPRLCLFACRDIESGEEVTFDYAGGINSDRHFSDTVCLCGSVSCFGYLPHNSI